MSPRIFIERDKVLDQVLLLVRQWPARSKALRRQLVKTFAEMAKHEIENRIPKRQEWKSYRESLEVVKIRGLQENTDAYSVRVNTKYRKVRKLNVPKTILFIRHRKQLRRIPPAIQVLEDYSPWTLDTLPFQPSRAEAMVLSRKVHRREVERVKKVRKKDAYQWRKELEKAGIRRIKKDRQVQLPKQVHALPDVAFEALRLEFGMGGIKAKAHWRPGLSKLVSGGIKGTLRRRKEFSKALTQLKYRGWMHWSGKTRNSIRLAEALKFVPFQKKLGIRVST